MVVVHRAVHVVDVLDLRGGDEAAKEFQLAAPECMDEHRCHELVHWEGTPIGTPCVLLSVIMELSQFNSNPWDSCCGVVSRTTAD